MKSKENGFYKEIESPAKNLKDLGKFYVSEIVAIEMTRYFIEALRKKYGAVFETEINEIESNEFHACPKLFKLDARSLYFVNGKLHLPGVATGKMFQTILDKIHKEHPEFPNRYNITENLLVECQKPVTKTFTCRLNLAGKKDHQLFYVKFSYLLNGRLAISANFSYY
jgi:hypothetical protein